jgi:predicted methyltransferase
MIDEEKTNEKMKKMTKMKKMPDEEVLNQLLDIAKQTNLYIIKEIDKITELDKDLSRNLIICASFAASATFITCLGKANISLEEFDDFLQQFCNVTKSDFVKFKNFDTTRSM